MLFFNCSALLGIDLYRFNTVCCGMAYHSFSKRHLNSEISDVPYCFRRPLSTICHMFSIVIKSGLFPGFLRPPNNAFICIFTSVDLDGIMSRRIVMLEYKILTVMLLQLFHIINNNIIQQLHVCIFGNCGFKKD